MSTVAELAIFPMDQGESVSAYVARCVSIIRESGLPYKVGPMGTSIEGEWDQVMETVSQCMKALQADCSRVYMTMTADYRKDRENAIRGKIDSLNRYL